MVKINIKLEAERYERGVCGAGGVIYITTEWPASWNARLFFLLARWLQVSYLRNQCLSFSHVKWRLFLYYSHVLGWSGELKTMPLKYLSQSLVQGSYYLPSNYLLFTLCKDVFHYLVKCTTFIFLNGIQLQKNSCRAITSFMIILYKTLWWTAQ